MEVTLTGSPSEAKANFFNSSSAGLKGLLHPLGGTTATVELLYSVS